MGHRTIHTPKLRKDWESLTPDPLVIFFFFCCESVLAGVGEAQVFSALISTDLHLRREIIFSLCSLEAPAENGVF